MGVDGRVAGLPLREWPRAPLPDWRACVKYEGPPPRDAAALLIAAEKLIVGEGMESGVGTGSDPEPAAEATRLGLTRPGPLVSNVAGLTARRLYALEA